MNEKYDKSKESIFLEYLDTNNLYEASVSNYLPCKRTCSDTNVMNIPDFSPRGYILEVYLSYPKELHDLHSDLPLAPENQNLPKLFTTLYKNENYVVHYTTLKLYLKLGLKLKKIHKVLKFNQSD